MKQPSTGHDFSALDLPEVSRRLDEWDRQAPSRFSKLRKQVAEWDSSERSRSKVLRLLDAARERSLEGELTGSLAAAFEPSYLRQAIGEEKEARVKLLKKASTGLVGAATALLQLAQIDEKRVRRLRGLGPSPAAEEARARLSERQHLASEFMVGAIRLEAERIAAQENLSTRRLGVFGKHGNLEWLLYIQRWLCPRLGVSLSCPQLALLIDAAHLAWRREEIDTDPASLKRTLDRFGRRNPDFLSLFKETA